MREIVETDELEEDMLDGFIARLEKNSDKVTEINETGTEVEKIIRYGFDEETPVDSWHAQIDIEVYSDNSFKARGDEYLVNQYFNSHRVQPLDL